MSDKRLAAEAKFEEQISEFLKSKGGDADEGILVDWMLLTAHHLEEAEGSATGYGIYGPKHQRVHQAAGLVEYARVKLDKAIR